MNLPLRELFNRATDLLIRPHVRLGGRDVSSFQVCGYTGLVLAVLVAMVQVTYLGLSRWVLAGVLFGAVATFFAVAMVTKVIQGYERIVYYHHQICVIVITALLVSLLRQPVLPYLDVTVLGLGIFLVCGRVGCLMVGCCHGRSHNWGVRYQQDQTGPDFPAYYIGVRLLPVQAIESVWTLLLVLIGSFLLLNNRQPGEVFGCYIAGYGVGRFWLEFLRGDRERPYLFGFSESQWISLSLVCLVAFAEGNDLLPFRVWHVAAAASIVLAMIGVSLTRRRRTSREFRSLDPAKVKSIAEALERLSGVTSQRIGPPEKAGHKNVVITCTTVGIRISASQVHTTGGAAYLYGLSSQTENMSPELARDLAALIINFKHRDKPHELITRNGSIFNLLVHPHL